MTIEDPIEYRLAGVNQMQVKPQIGLTFASALRHFLRQDANILLVGEMRDTETAQMAIQAALTGHLVLSTLHTSSAAGTIIRLRDMGVDDYLIAATVNGSLSPSDFVRVLCEACKEPDPAARFDPSAEGIPGRRASVDVPFRPVGCPSCRGSGYSGRVAVTEAVVMDAALRRAVSGHADRDAIRAAASEAGMQTMMEAGLALVRAGRTSIAEVLRCVRDDD